MKYLLAFLLPFLFLSQVSLGQSQCTASFTIVPDTANPCNFNFINTSTGGTFPFWSWTFGDGNSSFQMSPSHSYTANGSYVVTLLMVDSISNCFSTFLDTVVVTGCSTAGCQASFVIFPDSTNPCTFYFLNNSTGITPLNYSWNFGDGNTSTLANPSHTYSTNGTYTVTLHMRDASNCSSNTIRTVVVTGCGSSACQASFFAFPDSTNPCIYYFSNTSTGTAPLSSFWNFGNGNTSNLSNPTNTYTSNGTYTITLSITDNTGCTDSTTRTIFVSGCGSTTCQAAFVVIPDSMNSCTYHFVNNSTGAAPLSYSWNFGNGNTSNLANPSHTYPANGTYTVTLNIRDGNFCSSNVTQTVTVTGCSPTTCQASFFAFPDSTNPCIYYFSSNSAGAVPLAYSWNFGNGNTSTLSNPTNTYTSNGTYVVTLSILDGNGCRDSTTRTIFVSGCGITTCQAAFTFFPDSANPCMYHFVNNSTGAAPLSSRWNFGNGNTSSLSNPSHNFTVNGVYTVTLNIRDGNFCTSNTTQTIVVTGCGTTTCQASFSAFPDSTNPCTYYFSNTSSGAAPLNYSWNFGNGNTSSLINPSQTYTANGTYIVSLSATDGTGCTDSTIRTIVVTGCGANICQANFTATASMANPCTYLFTDLSTTSGTINSRFWEFGDGGTSTLPMPTHTYTSNGSYTATLIIQDNNGCIDTASQPVTVSGCNVTTCQAAFSYLQDALDSCLYSFSNNSSGTAPLSYSWDFGNGNTSTAQNPSQTFANSGVYPVRLIITDANACSDTVTQSIAVVGCNTLRCQARFTATPDAANYKLIHFQDISMGNPSSWLWDLGDGSASTLQHPDHTYALDGTYYVSLTIINTAINCGDSWTDTVVVAPGMSIAPDYLLLARLYPNPTSASSILEMELSEPKVLDWALVDMMGRRLISGETRHQIKHEVLLDLERFAQGVYMLQVKESGHLIYHQRVVRK